MTPTTKIITAGLILRLGLAFLYHPDIKSQAFHGQFVSRGVGDIYSYLSQNKSVLPYTDTFNYPPLAYLWLGANTSLAILATSGKISHWLNDWTHPAGQTSHIFGFLLLLKLPYLIIDLLFLSLLLVINPKNQLAVLFWAFNPLNLYATYAIGQFDLLPALCLLVGLITHRRRPLVSGAMLAIGAGLKSFPIIGAAIVLLSPASPSNKIQFLISLCACLFVIYVPVLFNPEFAASQLNSGLLSRVWEAQIASVPLVPTIVSVTLIFGLIKKTGVVKLAASLLTLTVSFIRPHAQWGVWTYPLIGFLSAQMSKLTLFFYLVWTISLFVNVFLLPDLFVFVGLFSSLVPPILYSPTLVSQLENTVLPGKLAKSLLVFSGCLFALTTLFARLSRHFAAKDCARFVIPLSLLIVLSFFLFPFVYSVKLINHLPVASVPVAPGSFFPLTAATPVTSEFSAPVNGLNQISLYMKNPSLKNTAPIKFELLDSNGNTLRSLLITGSNVGDGVHVPFRFPRITDSAGQRYLIRLTTTATNSHPIIVSLPNSRLAGEIFADPELDPHFIGQLAHAFFDKLRSDVFILPLLLWLFLICAVSGLSCFFTRTSNPARADTSKSPAASYNDDSHA